MPSAADFPWESYYGRPKDILYDGEVYSAVDMRIDSIDEADLEGMSIIVVTALPHMYIDQMMEELDEVEESGPERVIFNRQVYQKSFQDPVLVPDHVLRTMAAPSWAMPAPSPPQQVSQHRNRQTQIPASQPREITSAGNVMTFRAPGTTMNIRYLAGYLAAQAVAQPSNIVLRLPRPVPTRIMPLRTTPPDPSPLEYGFDLPLSARAGIVFDEPLPFNYTFDANGQKKRFNIGRISWGHDHKVYVWELIEYAMLMKGRVLERREFRAIVEALHRHFQGTGRQDGSTYPYRGFNTVHSMVVKHAGYEAFLAAVLP